MLTRRNLFAASLAVATAGSAGRASAAIGDSDGWAAADRLVAATGGAAAWQKIRGLRIAARHHETDVPEPYDNLIHMALDAPLMRFEGRNAQMDRVRVIDHRVGQKRSEVASTSAMTADQIQADLDWWEAHVYRNIWRLARRDSTIQPRLSSDGRLLLNRPDGRRLMWYRLNQAAEPVAFGTFDSEQGTVLGPLSDREGGLRSPVWTTRFDGTFRVSILEWTGLRELSGVNFRVP